MWMKDKRFEMQRQKLLVSVSCSVATIAFYCPGRQFKMDWWSCGVYSISAIRESEFFLCFGALMHYFTILYISTNFLSQVRDGNDF